MKDYQKFANCIRVLSIEMVDTAGSGHQGVCLGFADVMSVLWNSFYTPGEDRFVLSNGHASAMLYAAIFLSGNKYISIEDLKKFRKLGSKTQGHPERNIKLGIELTTGALGQGVASAVGLAIALKKKGSSGKVYVSVGDGDLMEGISHEAMTLASSLNLDNLVILFDDNDICIDGHASEYTTDNIKRFEAYGFETYTADGHNYKDIENVLTISQTATKPSFIAFKTVIGKFSKYEGQNKCHGKFLSSEDIEDIRKNLGLPKGAFTIDLDFDQKEATTSPSSFPAVDSLKLRSLINSMKEEYIQTNLEKATRVICGECLAKLSVEFNMLIGGSADLSLSTCCLSDSHHPISRNDFSGNYIHYGIRENAMGAIMSGLSAEGFIPFGSTFLVFSDYMRGSIRNSALMGLGNIYIFTHDSIAVGEDGATHQPIEQLSSLRAIPNLLVFRPCCDIEVLECLEMAILNRDTPSAIILTRQKVNRCIKTYYPENRCSNGMYEIYCSPCSDNAKKLTIISTGSEVSLALRKAAIFEQDGYAVRVISAPCCELFNQQDETYKKRILGDDPKLIIEAGCGQSWYQYMDATKDQLISVEEFGESGSCDELMKKFGFF